MKNRDFDLGQQIAELRGITIEGFKGVHQRQDVTNGRIAKAEVRIRDLETQNAAEDGEKKGVALSWGRLFAIIAATGTIVAALSKILEWIPK